MLDNLDYAVIFPVITVLCLIFFFLYYRKVSLPLAGTTEWITRIIEKPNRTFTVTRYPMQKTDILPLVIIIAVFSFLGFFQLGDLEAPQSFFSFVQGRQQIIIELEEPADISSLMFYTGLWTGNYTLEFSADGTNWQEQTPKGDNEFAMNQPHSHVFKWRYADINDDNAPGTRYIRITSSKVPIQLGELALYGGGKLIPVSGLLCPDAPELFDEQELIPARPTYMNSMYFDEIYHGRTALEHLITIRDNRAAPTHLQAIYPYETTHPPLGKLIIMVGIELFDMTPFGWRFMGTLFGVAMLAVFFILLKNMFGKTTIAVCGTLLLGFDFMRFVQTRIATIDTYGVFFILLAYLFIYRFLSLDIDAPFKKNLAPLAFSGLFFGIGSASKWIVIYSGIGLAVIYVIRLVMVRKYYKKEDIDGFGAYLAKTLLWSFLFFVVIPVIIYCLSYIPYGMAKGMTLGGGMLWNGEFYKIIWENQKSMLSYHGKLVAEHSYSSWWYQWIVDGRPILYYRDFVGDTKSAFAAFGNPLVWWGGLLAMIAMVVRTVKYRDGKALAILIGYLSQLLPWVVISRIVFIYHYFPSTLFIILALAHVFNTILERKQGRYKQAVYGFTAATGVLFVMFYPALTGMYAPNWYFRYLLRWIPGAWPF